MGVHQQIMGIHHWTTSVDNWISTVEVGLHHWTMGIAIGGIIILLLFDRLNTLTLLMGILAEFQLKSIAQGKYFNIQPRHANQMEMYTNYCSYNLTIAKTA